MKKPKLFTPARATPSRKYNNRAHIDALYDKAWMAYRIKYLAINTRCYACGARSEVIDHLIPHQGDIKLFEKTDNHIPLCAHCHNTVTGLFDYKHRPGQSIDPKLRWLSGKRLSRGLTFRVKVMQSYP